MQSHMQAFVHVRLHSMLQIVQNRGSSHLKMFAQTIDTTLYSSHVLVCLAARFSAQNEPQNERPSHSETNFEQKNEHDSEHSLCVFNAVAYST